MYQASLVEGIVGGLLMGAIFGTLAVNTIARTPSYNKDTLKAVMKLDKNELSRSMRWVITATVLTCLSLFGARIISYRKQNKLMSSQLAAEVLDKYFSKPLATFGTRDMPLRVACATALIINNMSEQEIEKLRTLATTSLFSDRYEGFSLDNKNTDAASKIIFDCIRKTPELEYSVGCIMRGSEPKTYFITNATQKTR